MEEHNLFRKPLAMFRFFQEISAIPRGSKNEKAVSDFLCDFAQKRGLSYYQDDLYNVVIKKPGAGKGKELPAVMLQGHLDMVCEKNAGCLHDFETDGLVLEEKDGFLYAKGTTLGADNGIAVAMMMALLDDQTIIHPPLECVFTVQEEIGLIGAAHLDGGLLSAKTMINLDSEEEGIATVSCAGGLRVQMDKPVSWEKGPFVHACRIAVSGLPGGHSGADIHLERTNANKLMGRILYTLSKEHTFSLCSVDGGNKDNAIPRECGAVVAFADAAAQETAIGWLSAFDAVLREEITPAEPHFRLTVSKTAADKRMDRAAAERVIKLLYLAPNGVLTRNVKQGGFVVSSVNLGVVGTGEEQVTFVFAPRSSVGSLLEEIKQRLALLAEEYGCRIRFDGEYPGWSYKEHSPIRNLFAKRYRALYGKDLKIEAIHAGLECGLFQSKLPGLDAIAVGPNIYGCHTPEERLDLASCERTYDLLADVLEQMAEQLP